MDIAKHLFKMLRGGGQCILAIIVSFTLVTSMIPVSVIPAYADEPQVDQATGTDPPSGIVDSDGTQQGALTVPDGGDTTTDTAAEGENHPMGGGPSQTIAG